MLRSHKIPTITQPMKGDVMARKLTKSNAQFQRAVKRLPLGVASNFRYWGEERTIYVKKGVGARIIDLDDNVYVDYRMGYGPAILGYAHPEVDQAAREGMEVGGVFALSTEREFTVAERISKMVPAAELVRFWGEPPLVREPDLALFGVARLDPPEEQLLATSPLRRYLASDVQRLGAAAAARAAIDRIRGNGYQFVLHFDVDVIADFAATNYPGSGGLSLAEVREALLVFAQQPELAAFELTAYNPTKDPDGSGAKLIIDLLAEILEARLKTLQAAAAAAAPPPVAAAAAAGRAANASPEKAASAQDSAPAAAPGEAWSSDSLDLDSDAASSHDTAEAVDASETSDGSSEESSGPHS